MVMVAIQDDGNHVEGEDKLHYYTAVYFIVILHQQHDNWSKMTIEGIL